MNQLALAIQLNDEASLADFLWDANLLLQKSLMAALENNGERLFTIWGNIGCGKSHLLQAYCQAIPNQIPGIYLPLKMLKDLGPQTLENLNEQKLIAIDDIDAIAQDLDWELALFHLYNKIKDNGKTILLISTKFPLFALPIKLPDLHSRLSCGLVTQLHELSDDLKINVLCQRAAKLGFNLPTKVGQFLLTRCTRNMHNLNKIINLLDQASLAAQRKITIPFVKATLQL